MLPTQTHLSVNSGIWPRPGAMKDDAIFTDEIRVFRRALPGLLVTAFRPGGGLQQGNQELSPLGHSRAVHCLR